MFADLIRMANFSLLGKLLRVKKDKVEKEKKAPSVANSDVDNNLSEKTYEEAAENVAQQDANVAETPGDEAAGMAPQEDSNIGEKTRAEAVQNVARNGSEIAPNSVAGSEIVPRHSTNDSSRRTSQSLYAPGDERRQAQIEKLVLKGKATSQHLRRIQVKEGFATDYSDEGVIVKCYKDCFECYPVELTEDADGESLFRAIVHFNLKASVNPFFENGVANYSRRLQ